MTGRAGRSLLYSTDLESKLSSYLEPGPLRASPSLSLGASDSSPVQGGINTKITQAFISATSCHRIFLTPQSSAAPWKHTGLPASNSRDHCSQEELLP